MGLFSSFFSNKPDAAENAFVDLTRRAFPGGASQIDRETYELQSLLNDSVDLETAKTILTKGKALIFHAQDKSVDRIAPSLVRYSGNVISLTLASRCYRYLFDKIELVEFVESSLRDSVQQSLNS